MAQKAVPCHIFPTYVSSQPYSAGVFRTKSEQIKPIGDGLFYSPSPVTVKFPSTIHLTLSVNLVVLLDFYLMTNISGNPALCSHCCCCCDQGRPSSWVTEPSLSLRSLVALAPACCGRLLRVQFWGGGVILHSMAVGWDPGAAALIRKPDLRALPELGCHLNGWCHGEALLETQQELSAEGLHWGLSVEFLGHCTTLGGSQKGTLEDDRRLPVSAA